MKRSWLAVLAIAALTPASASAPPNSTKADAWLQFGGPTRDFKLSGAGIAKAWPAAGPKLLWSRDLGDGYSSIIGDGRVLVTMYQPLKGMIAAITSKIMTTEPEPEVVIAMDAQTGKTLWEHRYPAPPAAGLNLEYGTGPQSTPLIADGLVYAVGLTGKLHALDLKTGRVAWSHDLWGELQGQQMNRGYSPSPLLYKDSIIVPLGGSFQALAAFAPKDGKLLWKGGEADLSPASPILVDVGGEDQLVLFNATGVTGHDPTNGRVLWRHPHKTDWGINVSTPVWGPDNRLFLSSAYGSGSRVLELKRGEDGKTVPNEVAYTSRMKIHFGTAVRVGDTVYGSSGDFGPAFFTAFDVKKGAILWLERGFARASFVVADDRFVLVDEDGQLLLAEATPKGMLFHGKVQALTHRAWTAPTLIGKRLYVRDRKTIKAYDLS